MTTRATHISAFGPLTVDDGRGPVPLRGKAAALVALVACFPDEVVGRELLVEALWDAAAPPPDAGRALRHVQRRLHSTLPGLPVAAVAGGMRLDTTDVVVDVTVCRELLRSDDPERLRQGLAMWTGAPFPDVAHVAAVQVASDRLAALRLDAVEALLESRLHGDDGYPLVAELEGLVALHPERERLWCQLAVVLHRCGRRVDALRALRRYQAANPRASLSPRISRVERALVLDDLERAG